MLPKQDPKRVSSQKQSKKVKAFIIQAGTTKVNMTKKKKKPERLAAKCTPYLYILDDKDQVFKT